MPVPVPVPVVWRVQGGAFSTLSNRLENLFWFVARLGDVVLTGVVGVVGVVGVAGVVGSHLASTMISLRASLQDEYSAGDTTTDDLEKSRTLICEGGTGEVSVGPRQAPIHGSVAYLRFDLCLNERENRLVERLGDLHKALRHHPTSKQARRTSVRLGRSVGGPGSGGTWAAPKSRAVLTRSLPSAACLRSPAEREAEREGHTRKTRARDWCAQGARSATTPSDTRGVIPSPR